MASIQNDVLKFKTSSVSYTMLDKYNTKDSDNTIKIGSTETQSKKLLTRLANDSAFELYAEIVADGNNKVTEVDARLTAATGKLVEYDQDKKRIKIETSGGEYELITTSKPKLTDEDHTHLAVIKGMVPSFDQMPKGCAFCPRCAEARDICRERMPELTEVDGQKVRCFKYSKEWEDAR